MAWLSEIFPDIARQKNKDSNSAQQYFFPQDLGQHCMHLVFERYSYDKRNSTGPTDFSITVQIRDVFSKGSFFGWLFNTTSKSGTRAISTITDSIALPLPENLTSVDTLRVRAEDLGALGGEVGTAAYDGVRNFVNNIRSSENAGDVLKALPAQEQMKKLGQVGAAVLIKDAIQATLPTLAKGLEVGSGYAFNPYQALTFDGVNIRSFTFDWTFAPSTRKESALLQNIINTIRTHIHPKYAGVHSVFGSGQGSDGRSFLQYPDIVHVKILGSPAGSMPVYKPCMVSNFAVNYVGSGEMAFLEGGKPAALKVSMTVSEMEIWTKDDFTNVGDEDIME